MIGVSLISIPFFGEISFGVSSITNITKWIILSLLIGGVLGIIGKIIYDKFKYIYYGEVYKIRQGDFEKNKPGALIVGGKAGYFTKGEKTVFRIKYGIMPWHQIEMINLPDPEFMVGNKAFFFQLNKDNYVQAKITIDWKKHGVKLEPVEDGMKFAAMLDLMEKDRVFEAKKLSPVVIGMIIMGLILITGIIVYYFLTKAPAPTPIPAG